MLKINNLVRISLFLIILFVFGCSNNNKYDINLSGSWNQYIESSHVMNDIKFNDGIYEYYFWKDIVYIGIYSTKENQLTIKINKIFGSSFSQIYNIYPSLEEKWYLEDELKDILINVYNYNENQYNNKFEELFNEVIMNYSIIEDKLTLTSVIKDYYSDGSSAIMEEVYNRLKDDI